MSRVWLSGLVLVLALHGAAAGQASVPRTPDGRPDFQGNWTAMWLTPLERPPEAKTLVVPESEAPALHEAMFARLDANDPLGSTASFDPFSLLTVRGEIRSSLLIDSEDGKLPYTAEGRVLRGKLLPPAARGADDPEQRPVNERCVGAGNGLAPMMAAPAGNIRKIVQTRDSVVIWTELYSIVRIVPLDGRMSAIGSRAGSMKGRWEGDTLVVESTAFLPGDGFRTVPLSVLVITPQTRITERFTLVGADEILYRFMVEDPAIYARAWTAETVFKRSSEPIFEFACHEGNYAMLHMLRGARIAEDRAAKLKPASAR